MKQQFEVGDKAVITVDGNAYAAGDEVEILEVNPKTFHWTHKVKFPNGTTALVCADILSELPTTPTTIVTVHGNPDWKPGKGELEYKLLKDLPGLKAGYLMSLGDVYFTAINPAKYPDFFAPVYKEAKPIEFVKGVNIINETLEVLGCMPPEAKTIHLLCKDYRETGWDLMFVEFDGTAPLLYLGHFNSGTI